MTAARHQSGFSIIEVIIVVAIVALGGVLGYTYYSVQQKTASKDVSTQSAVATDVQPAPTVSGTSDLDVAATTIDQTDPETSSESDMSEFESELADF